jgi:hypothetical protein
MCKSIYFVSMHGSLAAGPPRFDIHELIQLLNMLRHHAALGKCDIKELTDLVSDVNDFSLSLGEPCLPFFLRCPARLPSLLFARLLAHPPPARAVVFLSRVEHCTCIRALLPLTVSGACAGDVRRLLKATQGPPVRTLQECRALIHAVNGNEGDQIWQSAELAQLLTVMRKHPLLSVQELDQMLERCDSFALVRLWYESMCPDPECHRVFAHHRIGGIGLLLEELFPSDGGGFFVKEVIEGGPADADAHVRVGDQVWRIDGEEVAGKPFRLVKSCLRGAPDTYVEVEFIMAQYRLSKFSNPHSLPSKAWYSVRLQRKESEIFDSAFEGMDDSDDDKDDPSRGSRKEDANLWETISNWSVVFGSNAVISPRSSHRSSPTLSYRSE